MKKLILLELALLFLATTFVSDNPPGWYLQQLPVNDFVNDIFFLDSLTGWVVTNGGSNDTAYIIKTENGGKDWKVLNRSFKYYTKIQFFNNDSGYISGAPGGVWKTFNGGYNLILCNKGLPFGIDDFQFINEDTGWACSADIDFGGIWKTTNGGDLWIKQLSPPITPTLSIKAISILNKDTGWAINNSGSLKELYRTTNGGINWNVQYTFNNFLNDVQFITSLKGWITGGSNNFYSSDGGKNWNISNAGGVKLNMKTEKIGWIGTNAIRTIRKTTDGGVVWGTQQSTAFDNTTVFMIDTLKGWAGRIGFVTTDDGGGNLTSIANQDFVKIINYKLFQNSPNPFNPKTKINYELLQSSYVMLKIFNIQGKEIEILINQRQNSGKYDIEFDGSNLNSGVYFYRIVVSNLNNNKTFYETKSMVLLK